MSEPFSFPVISWVSVKCPVLLHVGPYLCWIGAGGYRCPQSLWAGGGPSPGFGGGQSCTGEMQWFPGEGCRWMLPVSCLPAVGESCAAGFCPGAEPTAISAGDMQRHFRVVGARAQLTAWKLFGWFKFCSGSGSSRLAGLQKPLGCARYLKFSVAE